MNKQEFLNKYPEIKPKLLDGYLQAFRSKNMTDIHHYSFLLAMNLEHDMDDFSKDVESLLNYYSIDYIYSEEWEKE